MSQYKSRDEAKSILKASLAEIDEILRRDLGTVRPELRNVDLWYQTYGKNPSFDLTKEVLRELEMNAIDCEIFLLDEKSQKKFLADTCS